MTHKLELNPLNNHRNGYKVGPSTHPSHMLGFCWMEWSIGVDTNSLDWKQHDDEIISWWWCGQTQSDGSPWCWESISKTTFIHDEKSKSEKPSAWGICSYFFGL